MRVPSSEHAALSSIAWLLFGREVDATKRHCRDSARRLHLVGHRQHINTRHANRASNLKRAGAIRVVPFAGARKLTCRLTVTANRPDGMAVVAV